MAIRLSQRKEAQIERYASRQIRSAGGMAVKLTSRGQRGWPDRLFLMPGGLVFFVEFKAPGGVLSVQQRLKLNGLSALGFEVRVVRTRAEWDELFSRRVSDAENTVARVSEQRGGAHPK